MLSDGHPHSLKSDHQTPLVDHIRQMLEDASSLRPDVEEGRWIIASRHHRRAREIIVEQDEAEHVLVVITAYPVVEEKGS